MKALNMIKSAQLQLRLFLPEKILELTFMLFRDANGWHNASVILP